MADILASLLACFQAYYKVMKDDLAKKGPLLPVLEHPPPDSSGNGLAPLAMCDIVFFNNYTEDVGEHGHVSDDNSAQSVDYTLVLAHVAKVIRHSEWPEDDRIPSSNPRTSTPLTPATATYILLRLICCPEFR